jgi:hypothetical protein
MCVLLLKWVGMRWLCLVVSRGALGVVFAAATLVHCCLVYPFIDQSKVLAALLFSSTGVASRALGA